jgi:DDE superfamily endonuclease
MREPSAHAIWQCDPSAFSVAKSTAYASPPTIIPSYKGSAANSPENARFNHVHATVRIATEHTIGQLKSRFGSLRGLGVATRSLIQRRSSGSKPALCCTTCSWTSTRTREILTQSVSEDASSSITTAIRKREFLKREMRYSLEWTCFLYIRRRPLQLC